MQHPASERLPSSASLGPTCVFQGVQRLFTQLRIDKGLDGRGSVSFAKTSPLLNGGTASEWHRTEVFSSGIEPPLAFVLLISIAYFEKARREQPGRWVLVPGRVRGSVHDHTNITQDIQFNSS